MIGTAAQVERVGRRDVEVKGLFHVLRGRHQKRQRYGAADVVDHDVDTAELSARDRRQFGDGREVGEVARDGDRPALERFHAVGHFVEVRGRARGDDHVRAALGQGERAGRPDAATGAGDDRHLVVNAK